MTTVHCLDEAIGQFRKLKEQAERAVSQVSDEQLRTPLDPESNSIAIIMKHLAGNLRSRWTDFLTADGEKPDRHRDGEFELLGEDTRERLVARWEAGWSGLFAALSPLTEADLVRTVLIRGEPHSVVEAIHRQLTHYACHVGQIVFLAKHLAGRRWQSLSVPRGRSEEFNVAKWSANEPGPVTEPPLPTHPPGKIMDLEAFAVERERLRASGRRLVFTNGCFDLLHVGHVRYLVQARALGERLLVALNTDDTVRRLKGPGRPVVPLVERAEVVAALACVDYVLSFSEERPDALIARVRPDVLVKGGDWPIELIAGRELVEGEGGTVHSLDLAPGLSTSSIIERIRREAG